jgi:hypothetical protein
MTDDNGLRKLHVIHKLLYYWLEQKCRCTTTSKPCERCFVLDETMHVFPSEASTVVNVRYNEIAATLLGEIGRIN